MTTSRNIPSGGATRSATRRFASARSVMALILREMSTTFGRSPGGYIWAVLEPAGGIALLSLVFSLGFRSPPLGTNFPLYYATGLVPFLLFNDISNKISQSLRFSKQLLAYPTITFVDALLARFLLNAATQLLVGYLIFFGILLIFETKVIPDFGTIALTYALLLLLSFGIGVLNCYLMTRFDLWLRIWTIATRPLFIISGVFFLYEGIPQPYRDWLWYNPILQIVGLMRRGFYPSYDAVYVSIPYVAGIGMISLTFGLFLLRRYHRDLQNSL